MQNTPTKTDYEWRARTAKASKLAQLFLKRGDMAVDLSHLDDAGWSAACQYVEVPQASLETRRLVVTIVAIFNGEVR